MRCFFLVLVYFPCLLLSAQNKLLISDNADFNTIIQGFYGYPKSPTGRFLSAQIEKAKLVNGVYRNVVRLWYGKDKADYINLLYNTYPTENAARAALKDVMGRGNGFVFINWGAVEGTSKSINLSSTTFRLEDSIIIPSKVVQKIRQGGVKEKHNEINLNMSFEGLRLNSVGRIEGVDEVTGLNANYYSAEKRMIRLRGMQDKAWVELVPAPGRKGTAVHFKAVAPNDRDVAGDKIRISGSVRGLNAVELVNSVDIYIPRSWKSITKQETGISWLTVQEYWCAAPGIPVEGEPQFRMTLGILKKTGRGNNLYFDLKAQDLETNLQADGTWKEKYSTLYELDDRLSRRFKIPFDQWFNLKTEINAGDRNNGHIRLIVTDFRGNETVIFDETCQTVATGYYEPGAKQPLYKTVSPLKLYTSAKTLEAMKGKPLEIYYDNWSYKAICLENE